MEPIIDSAIFYEAAVLQNPLSPAPAEVLHELVLIPVSYIGYDGMPHEGQIVMHRDLECDVRDFFALALDIHFPIEKVIPISVPQYSWNDERSCADNNSSGYNYRTIQGTTRLSNHARGCAFDINPRENIYVRYDDEGNERYRSPKDGVYDITKPGTLTHDHPLVAFMKARGWTWGGDWKREEGVVDYQHFERTP